MSKELESDKKILLCACKKYRRTNKNGILLLKLDLGRKISIYKTFYDTKNYEVFCFCPISKFNKNNILDNKKNEITDYFLVGGLSIDKQKSLIKLYKVNYNEEDFEKTEIEYIQDIEIENEFNKESKNFKGFNGNITCIIQSKQNGKIFVSCSDGNLHLLDIPNISSLYQFEKENINGTFILYFKNK